MKIFKESGIVTFFGKEDFFSNFYQMKKPIIYNRVHFHTTEALFMYAKALYFEDKDIAEQISKVTDNPKECKRLGRLVKDYDDNIWNKVRHKFMNLIVLMKFSENYEEFYELIKDIQEEIGSDREITFVEASPYDKIWGVGLGDVKQSDIDDIVNRRWQGKNLLGECISYAYGAINYEFFEPHDTLLLFDELLVYKMEFIL